MAVSAIHFLMVQHSYSSCETSVLVSHDGTGVTLLVKPHLLAILGIDTGWIQRLALPAQILCSSFGPGEDWCSRGSWKHRSPKNQLLVEPMNHRPGVIISCSLRSKSVMPGPVWYTQATSAGYWWVMVLLWTPPPFCMEGQHVQQLAHCFNNLPWAAEDSNWILMFLLFADTVPWTIDLTVHNYSNARYWPWISRY